MREILPPPETAVVIFRASLPPCIDARARVDFQAGGEDEMSHYEALGIKRMAKAVEIEVEPKSAV